MWPWGSAIACAVRRSEKLLHSLQGFKGFKRLSALRAGKRQAWTPIKGFKGFKDLRVFKGFKRFKGLRTGKRQAWTPIRSHWCVALGCLLAAGWSMPRECLSDVALGQRYCLRGSAFPRSFCTVCRVLRVLRVSVEGLANGRLGRPLSLLRVLRVFEGF